MNIQKIIFIFLFTALTFIFKYNNAGLPSWRVKLMQGIQRAPLRSALLVGCLTADVCLWGTLQTLNSTINDYKRKCALLELKKRDIERNILELKASKDMLSGLSKIRLPDRALFVNLENDINGLKQSIEDFAKEKSQKNAGVKKESKMSFDSQQLSPLAKNCIHKFYRLSDDFQIIKNYVLDVITNPDSAQIIKGYEIKLELAISQGEINQLKRELKSFFRDSLSEDHVAENVQTSMTFLDSISRISRRLKDNFLTLRSSICQLINRIDELPMLIKNQKEDFNKDCLENNEIHYNTSIAKIKCWGIAGSLVAGVAAGLGWYLRNYKTDNLV